MVLEPVQTERCSRTKGDQPQRSAYLSDAGWEPPDGPVFGLDLGQGFRGDHLTVYLITDLRGDASLKWPQANNRTEHQAHEGPQGGRSTVFQQPTDKITDPNDTCHHAKTDRNDDP